MIKTKLYVPDSAKRISLAYVCYKVYIIYKSIILTNGFPVKSNAVKLCRSYVKYGTQFAQSLKAKEMQKIGPICLFEFVQ